MLSVSLILVLYFIFPSLKFIPLMWQDCCSVISSRLCLHWEVHGDASREPGFLWCKLHLEIQNIFFSLVSSWWRHREAWVSPNIAHERKAQALRHSGFMGCYDSCRIPQWREEPGTLNRSSTSWCTAPLMVRYYHLSLSLSLSLLLPLQLSKLE